jgi:hypothetical protein
VFPLRAVHPIWAEVLCRLLAVHFLLDQEVDPLCRQVALPLMVHLLLCLRLVLLHRVTLLQYALLRPCRFLYLWYLTEV